MPELTAKILLCTALLGLQACAHVDEQSFYVTRASLQEDARHQQLSKMFVSKQTHLKYEDKEFVVTGHRIATGTGTVLAFRGFAPGPPFLVDQAGFQKITIYLPSVALKEGSEVHISDSGGAMAFYSTSSSNFPGSGGCFGYASTGSIAVISVSDPEITAKVDLLFRLSGPLGTALSDCDDKRIQATYTARKLQVQELTPWQGAAGKHIYDETIAP